MSNVDTHRAAHEAFTRRDFDAIAGLMRADAAYVDHPRGVTTKGPVEFTDWLKGWPTAFSDATPAEPRYIDGGEYSVCLFRARGTNDGPLGPLPATGRRMDLPFCEVLRYDHDGKIVEGEVYYDMTSMMVQLGHMQPPRMS
jgi:ketosteroid isomerase-like protein